VLNFINNVSKKFKGRDPNLDHYIHVEFKKEIYAMTKAGLSQKQAVDEIRGRLYV
tara:strand:+ start:5752 stop:5916 length:165 start_codon:yes stop_codon:yes gene_type:complete